MKHTLLFVLTTLAFASCATTSNLYPGTGRTFDVQAKSYDQVWNAAMKSVDEDMVVEEANKQSGTIRAKKYPYLGSSGEVVAIFIDNRAQGTYPIEIVTKNALQGPFQATSATDWTSVLTGRIKGNLSKN